MAEYKRLFDFVYEQLQECPLDKMVTSRFAGEWKSYSTQEFVDTMNAVSRGLLELGVQKGDKIALITTGNRAEWNIMDHAILQIGAIDVPIYPTMTEDDYTYIMNHAEVKLCFISDEDIYKKIKSIRDKVPTLKSVYSFEKVSDCPSWLDVRDLGKNLSHDKVKALSDSVKPEDMATIIYTSGTTGLPKGVMLSHNNISSNALDSKERLPYLEEGQSIALSFLPCCHIYERMLHYLYIDNRVSIYLSGLDAVKDDLFYVKPHVFSAVPRLLEKFYDGVMAKGMASTGIKKTIFAWSVGVALQWDVNQSFFYKIKLAIARKLVFSKVKLALGLENIKGVPSGSAALQARLARFFCGAGIVIKEGYGLTETSPVISVNTTRIPNMYRVGTVGKPINHVQVKIAQDGEILCKGPNVMIGYYREPEKTAEVLKDGWFATGDIGEIKDGFLRITDRKKELFKTSGGKYVAPQVVENAMKESIYIEQIIVIGDGQKFPAALIVPEYVALKAWAEREGVAVDQELKWLNDVRVIKMIEDEINRVNARFGNWEQVKAFRLLPRAFTIDAAEITPTLKLKRKQICANWKAEIDSIYN